MEEFFERTGLSLVFREEKLMVISEGGGIATRVRLPIPRHGQKFSFQDYLGVPLAGRVSIQLLGDLRISFLVHNTLDIS